VVPFEAITSSTPEDDEAFFEPSNDKAYRTPTHYVMPEGAKHI
jgi:ring-1,2-phenylacetyl-CoA epoxidase subunit PaaB